VLPRSPRKYTVMATIFMDELKQETKHLH